MCKACYEEFNPPKIINNKIIKAASLISKVYDWSPVGGNLHIVVDDWNLDDHSIFFCFEHMDTKESLDFDNENFVHVKEKREIERKCLLALLHMTINERALALALYEGWI